MSRVVVVGAGVGGLAAAARLAAGGHRVTVVEQADVVGGKLGTYEEQGFRFDTGPSLLTMPQVFEDLFRETGEPLEAVLPLRRLDPVAHYRLGDGTAFDASSDLDVQCGRLQDALGGTAGRDWRRLMRHAAAMWRASEGPFLRSTLDGAGTLARQAVRLHDLATIAPGLSLRGLGRLHLRDRRLRAVLDRYATYTGSDPRRAPAALASVAYAEQAFGAWYVDGGLRRLADALLDRCRSLGVDVRTGVDVAAVELLAGRAAGVRFRGGGGLPADVVVANVDATHLYGDLVDAPAAATARRHLARVTPSLSGFVLLLGLRGRTPGLAHHTVLFPRDYDAEFDAVFGDPARPVDDPTVYVSAPADPTLAPAGDEAWFVLVNAPRHGTGRGALDWRAPGLADAHADRVLAVLAERGLDVRDRIAVRAVRTPADLERDTRSVGGAIYGTASHGARAAFLRPANRSPVPGLFLVGGSAHPGGGLPLVALSAELVAGLVGPA